MFERMTVVHEVIWNKQEISAVGMDAVSIILMKHRGKANTDFYGIGKAWYDIEAESQMDRVIQHPNDNLSIRIHPPVKYVPVLDELGVDSVLDEPYIKLETEAVNDVELRYLHYQEVGKLSALMQEMSLYLKLGWSRNDQLRLTFPMSLYARHVRDHMIVLAA